MPSPPARRTAEAQSPPQAPDASSTTNQNRPKRPVELDTAQSKRPRLECDETITDGTAWHSKTRSTYTHGPHAKLEPPSGQDSFVWGWPVDG